MSIDYVLYCMLPQLLLTVLCPEITLWALWPLSSENEEKTINTGLLEPFSIDYDYVEDANFTKSDFNMIRWEQENQIMSQPLDIW